MDFQSKVLEIDWEISSSIKRGCAIFGDGLATKSCLILVTPWPSVHGMGFSMENPAESRNGLDWIGSNPLEWIAISFPRGVFPTQGSNPGLLLCRQTPYSLSH